MIAKALHLLSLLPQRPGEFCDRVRATVQTRRDSQAALASYSACSETELIFDLSNALNADIASFFEGTDLASLEAAVQQAWSRINGTGPFPPFHNAGPLLARVCYAIARALQPTHVVETGVCYGLTSAYLLQALETNHAGRLHSIDLPPLGKNGDAYVGTLVPRGLQHRWNLHRGTSRRLLLPLLAHLGSIDIFLHDSLHTYANMSWELAAAWAKLRPGGVLIADDVEGNAAFHELARRSDVLSARVVQESTKNSMFGIAVKCS
jgi:predicted O-methyltransferase YrrM